MSGALGTVRIWGSRLDCGCRANFQGGKRISIRRCCRHLVKSPLDHSPLDDPPSKGAQRERLRREERAS